MRRVSRHLLVLILCAGAVPALAQEPSPALMAEMQSLRGQVFKTDEDLQRIGRVLSQFAWELLLQASPSSSDRETLKAISFRFERSDRSTPARVDGRRIILATGPVFELLTAGAALGHDIYISNGHEFPVTSSVAYRPLAASPIIPLADPLAGWLEGGATHAMCPPDVTACTVPQGTAMLVGILGFVLAHEAAHILLEHKGDQTIERELAADAAAAVRLEGLLKYLDKDGQLTDDVRLAVRAGPPLMMMLLKSRRIARDWAGVDDPLVRDYERRRQRLLAIMPEETRDQVTDLLDPKTMEGSSGIITVASSETADIIYVDGLPYRPVEIIGHPVVMPAGRHVVFARSGNRLAYNSTDVGGGDRRTMRLVFREPICPPQRTSVDDAFRRREWFEVLLASGGLSCGETLASGVRVYDALRRLHLAFLIPEAPSNLDSDKEIRLVDGWRKAGLPLSAWR
jgi:hypothetical protein